MSVEKQAIRAAFSKAASHYDSVAEVQRRIALALLKQTPSAGRIIDAGSGTGFGSRALRASHNTASIYALDAAFSMCASVSSVQAICGDIEVLPFSSDSFDLYWSSLAWQWTSPALAAQEAARVLSSGGQLRVASLGPETLSELRTVFAPIDSYRHVREFHSLNAHLAALEAAGFEDICVTREDETVFAPDLRSLLRDIRTLGAHELGSARRPGLLGKQAWQVLQAGYELYRTPAGLPARYDVIYLSARKP